MVIVKKNLVRNGHSHTLFFYFVDKGNRQWMHGYPGRGKTTLCSMLFRDIDSRTDLC